MVVNAMLSDEMIEGGRILANELAKSKLAIRSIFWILMPEAREWRYIIATSDFKKTGPKKSYQALLSVLHNIPEKKISLLSITVVDNSHPLVLLLRSAIKVDSPDAGVRFTGNTVNGVLIDDAYIYKST